MPDLEAIGAFLSGVAAVIGTVWAARLIVKRERRQCQERIDAFKEGIEMGREKT